MKARRLTVLTLVLLLLMTTLTSALAVTTETCDDYIQTATMYSGATAVQYALWQDGQIVASGQSGVYSKTENRLLLDTDLFGIGSVSKMYTTAAVMTLVEEGKLALDAPVTQYLPDFTMADPRYVDITVEMLLNHSSGLLGGTTQGAILFADTDQSATENLLQNLATQRLQADPGAYSVYCNDGFTLAQLVVENVTGQDFISYLRTAILEPNGLDNTFAPQEDFDTTRLVKTYQNPTDTRPLPQDTLGIVGAGGLYATATDLATFGGLLTGTELLSAASTTAMAQPAYQNGMWPADDEDLLAYGLGWDSVKVHPFSSSDIQGLSKGGDTLYYHAALVVIPQYNMTAAVLSSGGSSMFNQLAATQMLVAALEENGVAINQFAPVLHPEAQAVMPPKYLDYSGYYGSFAQQMELTVSQEGTLTLHALNTPTTADQVYYYHEDGSFRDPSGMAVMLGFVEEESGTYLWQKAYTAIPGLGTLPTSNYCVQKLAPSQASQGVLDIWAQRSATPFLPVNLKYTDQFYLALGSGSESSETVPGYFATAQILDEWTAQTPLQIPGIGSRELQDYTAFTKDNTTYLSSSQGILYQEFATVETLYTGAGAYCTIGENGYARWYDTGNSSDKEMTVTLPENSGFYVYDQDGTVTYSSVVFGDEEAVLPANGAIVFVGEPGTRFYLNFQ